MTSTLPWRLLALLFLGLACSGCCAMLHQREEARRLAASASVTGTCEERPMGKKKTRGASAVKSATQAPPLSALEKLAAQARNRRVAREREVFDAEPGPELPQLPQSPSAALVAEMEGANPKLPEEEIEKARDEAWASIPYELKKPNWLSHIKLPPLPGPKFVEGLEIGIDLILRLEGELASMCSGLQEDRLAAVSRVKAIKEAIDRSKSKNLAERLVELVDKGSVQLETAPDQSEKICLDLHQRFLEQFPGCRLTPNAFEPVLRVWVTARGPAATKPPLWPVLQQLLKDAGLNPPKPESLRRMYAAFRKKK